LAGTCFSFCSSVVTFVVMLIPLLFFDTTVFAFFVGFVVIAICCIPFIPICFVADSTFSFGVVAILVIAVVCVVVAVVIFVVVVVVD
jgi:hypothetical protein